MRRGEANSWGVQDIRARAFPFAHPRPSPGREEKPAAPAEIQSECSHAMDYVANQTTAPADLQALSERMKGLEPSTFCMASRRSSQLSYIREAASIASAFRV
jgi:hypothetical protein